MRETPKNPSEFQWLPPLQGDYEARTAILPPFATGWDEFERWPHARMIRGDTLALRGLHHDREL